MHVPCICTYVHVHVHVHVVHVYVHVHVHAHVHVHVHDLRPHLEVDSLGFQRREPCHQQKTTHALDDRSSSRAVASG